MYGNILKLVTFVYMQQGFESMNLCMGIYIYIMYKTGYEGLPKGR